MDEFFASNPGIRSGIAHHIDFPDYARFLRRTPESSSLSEALTMLVSSPEKTGSRLPGVPGHEHGHRPPRKPAPTKSDRGHRSRLSWLERLELTNDR
jgi:hypothetical protein